jgi:uncharacterized protein
VFEGRARLAAIFFAACGVGICSGLFGIGGGALLVPLLVVVFGFEQHRAQGTSLVALVPPTGLLAIWPYYSAHQVDIRAGLLMIPGIVLGGIVGGKFAGALPPKQMRRGFAAFVFFLGAFQVVSVWRGR